MMRYTADNGQLVTDEDIDRWAADAEAGFPNSTLIGFTGRPWEAHKSPMVAKSVRAPEAVWALVAKRAKESGITESEWIRTAITQALAS